MKNKTYHTVGPFLNPNRIIVEKGNIDIPIK